MKPTPLFKQNGISIYHSDNVELMRAMRPECIDLIVTSPPYDDLRTYGKDVKTNAVLVNALNVLSESSRLLKKGGVMCWVVGDAVDGSGETLTSFRHAAYAVAKCGLLLHDTMIWQKSNFSNPSTNRYHQVFEYVFVFSKGPPKTFNPIKDKPNKEAGKPGARGANTVAQRDGSKKVRPVKTVAQFGMRGNVWYGNTAGQENRKSNHPARMPKWLAHDLIVSWSNPGDVVLDPFNGSGTTLEQAYTTGRRGVGIDDVQKYCKDAAANLKRVMAGVSNKSR